MDEITGYPPRVNLFGIDIDPFTMDQTVMKTQELIESESFAHLIGVNADKVLQILDSDEMREIVRRCEIVNADGASMVLASKRLGVQIPERVAGIDLMYRLCELCEKNGYGIYLLGAKEEVVEKTRDALLRDYPALRVCGIHDGYFSEEQCGEIADLLLAAKPQVIFVGITSPKKERIIEYFRGIGAKGAFVGVGGSFDVVSGDIPRAPVWMQDTNLEWLFRMFQEPRRLAKRYLVGNVRFMRLVESERKRIKKEASA